MTATSIVLCVWSLHLHGKCLIRLCACVVLCQFHATCTIHQVVVEVQGETSGRGREGTEGRGGWSEEEEQWREQKGGIEGVEGRSK